MFVAVVGDNSGVQRADGGGGEGGVKGVSVAVRLLDFPAEEKSNSFASFYQGFLLRNDTEGPVSIYPDS